MWARKIAAGMARWSSALVIAGLLLIAFGVGWYFGLVPGSRIVLPPPAAEQRIPSPTAPIATSTPRPLASTPTLLPTAVPSPTLAPLATPSPTPAPTLLPVSVADAPDRAEAAIPGGYAVRLAIPSIKLDTPVTQGGIVLDSNGDPVWETVPFIAIHYGDLTSLLGKPGNAVISGHVVTLSEGNVFRFLYQVDIDDEVQVWDQLDREHDYSVVDVKLVPPTDVSVMAPTPDETLTLITCGGTFDPRRREFSDRLIVTAKPAQPEQ
jgi:LPXTG-site transpeptidase (sortase) family protein